MKKYINWDGKYFEKFGKLSMYDKNYGKTYTERNLVKSMGKNSPSRDYFINNQIL